MFILPAIDLYEQKAVRLYQGDYKQMTVYHDNPAELAEIFQAAGAGWIHIVDLEGALHGTTPHAGLISSIVRQSQLKIEIGGGIRSEETIKKYLDAGVERVILGTAALTNPDFLCDMSAKYGSQIAAGVDCKDGLVAIKGWTETSTITCEKFCEKLQQTGIETMICTDISRDGAMKGTNRSLYLNLAAQFHLNIIASGGISSLEDIQALRRMNLYGAIIGKAYYSGAVDLAQAIEVAK